MTRAVTIDVRSTGQAFGCYGVVRDARTRRKIAETGVKPNGFTAADYAAAESICVERGWSVRSEHE